MGCRISFSTSLELDRSKVASLSMSLSMNSHLRVPAGSSHLEPMQARAHVAYSCKVNSKSHNPSGRGFESHPPHPFYQQ